MPIVTAPGTLPPLWTLKFAELLTSASGTKRANVWQMSAMSEERTLPMDYERLCRHDKQLFIIMALL